MSTPETDPLDVWLRFDSVDDEEAEAEAEANTYRTDTGYRVEWSLTSVGLVKSPPEFASHREAQAWLEREGFQDFTS